MSSVIQRATPVPTRPHVTSVCPEKQFVHSLRLEMRRAERSGRVFLLALIDTPATESLNGRSEQLLNSAAQAICPAIRDTDIIGWYEQDVTLGVILTFLEHASRAAAKAAVDAKLSSVLSAALSEEDTKRLRTSYYFFPETDGHASADHPLLYPDKGFRHASRRARVAKRAMDISGSLLLLLLFAPVFLAIAVLIKNNSKGPVLFRQTRVGQYGKTFTFLKFRSMYVNNDPSIHRDYVKRLISGQNVAGSQDNDKVFKIVNDPRVTPLGRILRKSSLDEIPQFINVLKGDMSLIGPRPPVPYEFEHYEVWHRRRVMEVKPGITGLWQVNGRSRTTFDEMVRLDLQYARTWSIWLDLKILLRTPAVALSGKGAY